MRERAERERERMKNENFMSNILQSNINRRVTKADCALWKKNFNRFKILENNISHYLIRFNLKIIFKD